MRNSWLSFTLPDDLRNLLHEVARKLSNSTKFSPMALDDLHMTAVFMGKSYREKDRDVLFEIIASHKLSGRFTFDKLIFFPPSKNNLIVALFKAPVDLMNRVCQLKKDIKEKLGYDVPVSELTQHFIPHVTLGKLNLTKYEVSELIKLDILQKMGEASFKNGASFEVNTDEPLYLCGGA
ncbi:hypothetical protein YASMINEVIRUS_558 [Yasminevirus sp. GU-2018]|uniref:Uncharacterized protein n=1 Tax=Yasminevirus sp. GU-2018 TaxID=2420051 RepID=A0A5K0U8H2_9VIRU|nr:hypothetical protein YASMINEVIRUS_558 [Yasminevirus sp. GU-2018]